MSYADFLADAVAVREFGEWYVEFYITDPSGGTTTLRFSRWGTPTPLSDTTILVPGPYVDLGSYLIPGNTPYPKRVLDAPTYKQAIWNGSVIGGESIPSYGNVTLNNMDEGITKYSPDNGYIWADCEFRVFYFDSRDLLGTVGVFAIGKIGSANFANGKVSITLLGFESQFSVPLSNRVYRGSSYMLEQPPGGTITFNTTTAAPAATTGNMTLSMWLWLDALPSVNRFRLFGWSSATTYSWGWGINTDGTVNFRGTIGGSAEVVTSTFSLLVKTSYHLAIVVSGRDVTFYFYDPMLDQLTVEAHANAFSSATRQALGGGGNYEIVNSDAQAVLWYDEVQVWNVARTIDDIVSTRSSPYATGSVPANLVHYLQMDDGAGSTVTDSSATVANGTITAGSHVWLWAMEGGPELAGTPKPDAWGDCFGCKPVLVGAQWDIYQSAGAYPISSYQYIREGGNPITIDTVAASYRAFIIQAMNTGGGATAAGHAYPYLARALFKLGNHPTDPISVDQHGYVSARGTGSYINKAGDIFKDIATFRAGVGSPDTDTAAVTAFNTAAPYVQGVFIPDPTAINIDAVFNKLCDSCGLANWGYKRGSSLLSIGLFSVPVVADFALTKSHIVGYTPLSIQGAVIYLVNLNFAHNFVRLDDTNIAVELVGAGFNPSTIGVASVSAFKLDDQTVQSFDKATRDAFPGKGSRSVTVNTYLRNKVDAQTVADHIKSVLAGTGHRGLHVSLSAVGKEITFGNGVTLLATDINDTVQDNLDGAQIFAVLSVFDRKQDGVVELDVWR